MKRVLSVIALLFIIATSTFAQLYVGGSLGSCKVGGSHSVDVVPEVGYCLNTHICLSFSVGYSTFRNEETSTVNHSLYVAPCYTYVIPLNDKWSFDINSSFGYSRFFRISGNLLGIYLGPQLEYAITEKWTLWGAFDAIAVECEWTDGEPIATNLNFNWFNTGIDIGFYYYF